MEIKNLFIACILLVSLDFVQAQTKIERTVGVKPGQVVSMHFDYPPLIRVTTWDKNEILIEGDVSINGGENNEAFELITSAEPNKISISNRIKNFDKLPRRITINKAGRKMIFKSDAELKTYLKDTDKVYESRSEGVDIEIMLSIKVPINVETTVESIYGMVEINDFKGALTVLAIYGGTDVSLTEQSIGELTASTNYGEIFTNLNQKFSSKGIDEEHFQTKVSARLGIGPRYQLESQYGNVYLRKSTSK